MFPINHFRKVGEDFLHFFIIHYFFIILKEAFSDEHACDAKTLTPYERETDHHIWQGNFVERLTDFELQLLYMKAIY